LLSTLTLGVAIGLQIAPVMIRVGSMQRASTESAASPTILLVDDDFELLEIMSELLQIQGYSTLQAQNGQKAIDLLKKTPRFPSLIVLDMSMPVLDGRGFLEQRARDAILRDIPVVIVSGSEAPAIPLTDIMAYLRKPVKIERLMSVIESIPSNITLRLIP
jgi:CheY-like chemotaxis protein